MVDTNEWHKIGDKLTSYLNICKCQRKLKSIVNILCSIYNKIDGDNKEDLTEEEHLICALLDKNTHLITHGTNIEYPIIFNRIEWEWILSIKNDINLEDN